MIISGLINYRTFPSATEKEAELALESFDQKWSKQYPHIAKSWYNNWDVEVKI
ncbi:hypothetical protein [Rickettsia endosymbiont of Urophora cardui]|uniref:hypothetical protein n=1 Tax=Rickettsia endosymbiont of Urophora cardui TaxID=3066265 RepID=UPI00313DD85B